MRPVLTLEQVQLAAKAQKQPLVCPRIATDAGGLVPLAQYVPPQPRGRFDVVFVAWPWSYDAAEYERAALRAAVLEAAGWE